MKSKKFKYAIIFSCFISFYFLIYFFEDSNIFYKAKSKVPVNLKENIKTIFFPFKLREERDLWKSYSLRSEKILKQSNLSFQINSNSKLNEFRDLILEQYILEYKQVEFSQLKLKKQIPDFDKNKDYLEDATIFKINYYDINHYGFHHPSKNECKNKKLIIYANGHSDSAYEHNDFLKFKDTAIKKCYDFLVLGMTGLGPNKIPEYSFPGQRSDIDKMSHEVFKTYYDPGFQNKKPLSLMLSGNYYLIKEFIKLKKNYSKIIMVGLSGGGWYTTLLPSIITEIDASFSIAGSQPLIFYTNPASNDGDWEQHSASIYDKIDYVDLYLLSTLDKNLNSSRKHFQIYNDEDTCCFTIGTSSKIKKIFDTLGVSNLNIIIWNNNRHSLLVEELMELVEKLN